MTKVITFTQGCRVQGDGGIYRLGTAYDLLVRILAADRVKRTPKEFMDRVEGFLRGNSAATFHWRTLFIARSGGRLKRR